jgi:peptidoglycan/LPS O-acetylase OafA/YrhL
VSTIKRELTHQVTGLNSIRGIAVIATIFSHFHTVISTDPQFRKVTPWAWVNQAFSRGFLGVDVFFVLSGFLITSLLLKDGDINVTSMLRGFYLRRVLRILPALYTLLAASLLIALWEGFPLSYQWNSTWSALLFISNWTFRSFFLRTQDDLGHLWSLAVEEQFYLVWPLVFVILGRFRIHWLAVITGISATVLAVAIYRNHLFYSQLNWLFIYPKIEARSDAILIGCLCAYVFRYVSISSKILRNLGYTAATVFVLIAYFYGAAEKSFLYQGGFTLIAILGGVVVLATAILPSFGGRLLTLGILQWWGQRSYGLYMWHFFVFRIFSRHVSHGPYLLRIALAIGTSIAITEISWRLIEHRFIKIKNLKYGR